MLFLRTLLTPGLDTLATHVRSISVSWDSLLAEPIDPVDLPLFHAAAQLHGLTEPCTMTNDFVELLLHLLPRVHSLVLRPADTPSTYDTFLGSTTAGVPLPLALRSVRNLSCTWNSHYYGVTGEMFLMMMTLPNIRTLDVQILDGVNDALPTATSAVTTLHILYSGQSIKPLAPILRVPRALTHLSFIISIHATDVDLLELHHALEPQRNTIQLLDLRLTPDHRSAHQGVALTASFATWPVLRGLRCPLRMLPGDRPCTMRRLREVFPPNLCELQLFVDYAYWYADVLDALLRLIVCMTEVVPLLRKVAISGNCDRPVWMQVWSVCRQIGIELVPESEFEFAVVEEVGRK
ncbi:hypothetical protein Q9L58_001914 [Maublancomyces gigas]|uniref:F-box domain-containing protein n=1 Tax=Discina gigas TaxID=1032678 RepID=A0ABR3GSZ8_9PEZI